MDYQVKTMGLKGLVVGMNTRVGAKSNDFEGMARSLEDRGMDEPVQVWKNEEGKLEVLRGHRRLGGAAIFAERNPKGFKNHFPDGIPVIIRRDVTNASEAALAKVDHGTVVALRYRCERDRAVCILKDEGCTEEEIVSRCEGIFAKHQTAVSSDKRDKLDALRKDPAKNRKEIRRLLHETYKGQLQASIAVWKCPKVVQQALEFLEAREPLPKGAKAPTKLTYGDVKKLAKALEGDITILKDGVPVHSKGNPGPGFAQLWAELLKTAVKTGDVRAKAMSAKAMQDQLTGGTWDSEGFKALTLQHSGKKDVVGLKAMDAKLYLVDLVIRHQPKAWGDFRKIAEGIKQGIADGTLNAG